MEAFLPTKRLLPGQLPAVIQHHASATLTIVSDEGSDIKLASNYLVSCGARARYEKDFLHRWNNSHNCAVAAAGFSDVVTKVNFLSRVNRTPWASSANSHIKAELFMQMTDVAKSDARMLETYEDGLMFDKRLSIPETDSFSDEFLGTSGTIDRKTEGVPCLKVRGFMLLDRSLPFVKILSTCQLQVEMKRFFAMLKQWRHIDRAWTLEFLSLDVWMRGGNKAAIEENTGQAGLDNFFQSGSFHRVFFSGALLCNEQRPMVMSIHKGTEHELASHGFCIQNCF